MRQIRQARLDTEKLKAYIEENGTNMSGIADKIGVSPSCVSRFMNNKRPASGAVWSGLIGLFGKKVFDYIFFETVVSNDTTIEKSHKKSAEN
ncbi:helix-turn-helix domain-containing protein [Paenibacillus dendritiformis]|uniref:helix-turn-helix domain-containing protein n=1 Tax=Paenibacillus dendritiformis TaxID=130049 RepID=UPI00140D9E76|nr:helix-turn-helix transcriptional regulator [Paenibacillus dendritiformis]